MSEVTLPCPKCGGLQTWRERERWSAYCDDELWRCTPCDVVWTRPPSVYEAAVLRARVVRLGQLAARVRTALEYSEAAEARDWDTCERLGGNEQQHWDAVGQWFQEEDAQRKGGS